MGTTETSTVLFGLGWLELLLVLITLAVVIYVIIKQIHYYNETKGKIKQLADFFPEHGLKIFKASITDFDKESETSLRNFINKPRPRMEDNPSVDIDENNDGEDEAQTQQIKYDNVELILAPNNSSQAFKDVVYDTNAYLCKNVGSAADFTLLQDICERKIESLETQINNTINVPLYLGLAGTFIGIITGLVGIVANADELFSEVGNMAPLQTLLAGVIFAMIASFIGLFLMIKNTAVNHKKALNTCIQNKNNYYDFLRRNLMPELSHSMASSLTSLKGVLGNFIGKFGQNLNAYANSAALLNDNIEKQHLLLIEINKMKTKDIAVEIADTFNTLKDSSDALKDFRKYQDSLNRTIQEVDRITGRIDDIIHSFNDFAKALDVVVENQVTAKELQEKFQTAIETHFPTGSEAREMWRKEFDYLSSDAKTVSEELNNQLKASTEYIHNFIVSNKDSFTTLNNLQDVINKLIEYSNVQATCYKDLKEEIKSLKEEQQHIKSETADSNKDLLAAIKDLVSAIKTLKK